MKKLNSKGFSAVEGLLILVIIVAIGFVGWYVWHGRQVKSINTYDECVTAGGTTDGSDIPGIHGECTVYGHKYLEDGYVKWDLGQRFNDVTHDDKLKPSIVLDANLAPKELVSKLKEDNGGCAIGETGDHKTLSLYKIIRVVENKYAKLAYGCDGVKLDAFMIAVNTSSGWRTTSPTGQFNDSAVPSCALVNYFQVSKVLEPKCFTSSSDSNKQMLNANTNP